MSKLGWYWHRLRAMTPGEMALHARKKWRQAADAKRTSWPDVDLACSGAFPKLPKPEDAPEVLREALRRDVDNILAGRWRFFGHLEVQVDDPPKWQFDHLVRRDVETTASAFKLNYRALTDGVDSKLVWEPSRWNQLVRLAMAAYVLGDRRAGEKCVEWLEDWVKHNPPYLGWNWTSALEVGLRLLQFTWIDALLLGSSRGDEAQSSMRGAKPNDQSLLTSAATLEKRLAKLRTDILPPHVWYAWRHQSFGSSANNHLLGELVGCMVATVRWPGLGKCGASLDELQRSWQHEVLAQFAEDGGNKEQALNYQLFSWEFCYQAMHALAAAGRTVAPEACLRLLQAGDYFVKVQSGVESWDYGDSDNALVSPLFCDERQAVAEWWNWLVDLQARSPAIDYWLSDMRHEFRGRPDGSGAVDLVRSAKRWRYPSRKGMAAKPEGDWLHFPESGQGVAQAGFWTLRWDLSPLGYLATAAHGHLDALHLSIWWKGVALVVDPGTGAYHSDQRLRAWLASREAHNGPSPTGVNEPERVGAFLWSRHHRVPLVSRDQSSITGVLNLTGVQARRTVSHSPLSLSWKVEDSCFGKHGQNLPFTVRWQFAPGSWVKRLGDRKFSVHRADVAVLMEVNENWAEVELVEPVGHPEVSCAAPAGADSLEGIVSPAFRKVCWAPYLKLVARPPAEGIADFGTTFLTASD